MISTKVIVSALTLFLGVASAHAGDGNWTPIVQCGGGALEVDGKGQDGTGEIYQLVLRDPGIIADFISKGAINSKELNSKNEYIIPASQGFSRAGIYYYGYGSAANGFPASSKRFDSLSMNDEHTVVSYRVSELAGAAPFGLTSIADFTFTDCR